MLVQALQVRLERLEVESNQVLYLREPSILLKSPSEITMQVS